MPVIVSIFSYTTFSLDTKRVLFLWSAGNDFLLPIVFFEVISLCLITADGIGTSDSFIEVSLLQIISGVTSSIPAFLFLQQTIWGKHTKFSIIICKTKIYSSICKTNFYCLKE